VTICTGHGLKDPDIITKSFSYQVLPSEMAAIEDVISKLSA